MARNNITKKLSSPTSSLLYRQEVTPTTCLSPPKSSSIGRKSATFDTMIQAAQRWLSSHRTPSVAALLMTACVAAFSILFGTTAPNSCPPHDVAPVQRPGWWGRRLRRIHANCSKDPLADMDEPPPYFLDGVSRQRAQENWDATRRWRRENQIGTILKRPHRHHELIRQLVPTSMYQHDREGNIVVVEKWGEADVDRIKSHGLSHEDLVYNYMFEMEWLWSVAATNPTDKITLVMDVGGITFEQFTAWETMRLVRDRVNIGCNHYPNRAAHLLIVNVPSFFSGVYRFAEPLLSDQTKSRIKILSESDVERGAMTKIIHPKQLLKEYGGRCKVPFGHSALDQKLRRHVQKALRKKH